MIGRETLPDFNVSYTDEHKGLSKLLGCQVSVLDFSACPTGTHKIIKAYQALSTPWAREYRRRPFAAISSGNYARALKYAAEDLNKRGFLVVSREKEELAEQLRGPYTEVIFIEDIIHRPGVLAIHERETYDNLLNYGLEAGVYTLTGKKVRNVTNLTEIWDVQNRGPNLEGGEYLIHDLQLQLDKMFTKRFNFVPCGSGELLCSLALQGYGNFYGVTPEGHPLVTKKRFAMPEPESFADKLVTPVAPMEFLVEKIRRDFNYAVNLSLTPATEDELKRAFELSQEFGLCAEPSGAAGLVVGVDSYRERKKLKFNKDDSVLIVNTGDGEQGNKRCLEGLK